MYICRSASCRGKEPACVSEFPVLVHAVYGLLVFYTLLDSLYFWFVLHMFHTLPDSLWLMVDRASACFTLYMTVKNHL